MMCQMFDSNDLKHAIKSFTGTDVSDDFISIMQKQLDLYGNTEIDFEEFRESFLKMTRSLYPTQPNMNGHGDSTPPSPPPSPMASLSGSSSPISTPPDLLSPPNSPRGSDSASPVSASPPRYLEFSDIVATPASSIAASFVKPNPISPRRLGQGTRVRSSSLGSTNSNSNNNSNRQLPKSNLNNSFNSENGVVPIFNDDQAFSPKSYSPPATDLLSSCSVANSPQDYNGFNHNHNQHQQQQQQQRNSNSNHNSNSQHHQQAQQHFKRPPLFNKQPSHNDLFMTLMSLNSGSNDDADSPFASAFYSNSKKNKSSSSSSSKKKNRDDDSGVCSEEDEPTFYMEEDWNDSGNHRHGNGKPKRFTYGAKNRYEEIGWATEEFYYDPTLTHLDDLHEVISILKEKYTISSSKVKELEKKIQVALKSNQQLEDDLGTTKKEYITMSLKNNAFAQSKAISDQMLEECNLQISQLKQCRIANDKEIATLKKKLIVSEEMVQKFTKAYEDSQTESLAKEVKHHNEIESLNQKHNCNIENLRNQFQYEMNEEKDRFNKYCEQVELEKKSIQEENNKLKETLERLNQQIYSLQTAEAEEKQNQSDLNNESMSYELLTTETFNLNTQLHSWKKRYQQMEAKKIVDLKKELKRSKKQHSDYESLILQGIQDFNKMETTIDHHLNNNNNNNNNSNNNSNNNNSNRLTLKQHNNNRKHNNNDTIVKSSPNTSNRDDSNN
ncbi:hypothetical protein PPL_05241 [Heterostelium album PN500]|uniref:Uncharacterized protein n=1 Tax=Heterostelium pallidum (strain ATCC 26659 / Pp 5 / PN500) TaxID=670386 RepID=D3B9U4_HETP5|nr:hypothetical protein PPL_05241 [Heterostelium album PN500]EFA82006.1 hypothetical protein PPL_05241 [Heterostelium album PN500]|eukprot:XP_020434123.1 hypothetical protein PPL_05241 [Heterostelium album PN500]